MISGKNLKELVALIHDDATIYAYEGEDTGLLITMPNGTTQWIRARDTVGEDDQDEFTL